MTVARAAATGRGGAVFIEDQGPMTEWAREVPRLMHLSRGSVPVVNGRGSLKRNSMRHSLSPSLYLIFLVIEVIHICFNN